MKKARSMGLGILVAFTASLCCITPVLALISGVSGIAATFSWMEPFRPFLIALTIGVLGFAWYQKLRPRSNEEIECDCEEDPSFWQSRSFLGIVTVVAGLMLAFPGYAHIFYPDTKPQVTTDVAAIKMFDFEVEGMTCAGCEEHVKHAVGQLPGVLEADASYENAGATIKFDPEKVTIDEITETINATGYKVTGNRVSVAGKETTSKD